MPTKDRLRALRLEANRTQIQIAKLLHIEGRTYQRLELEDALHPAPAYSVGFLSGFCGLSALPHRPERGQPLNFCNLQFIHKKDTI